MSVADDWLLHEDRLFPAEPGTRGIARRLFAEISKLSLICPHGHTDAAWFSTNEPFSDPARLLVMPDHYLLRMLVSQGVSLDKLGAGATDGVAAPADGREVWRLFANHYHVFRSTPSRLWLDHTFQDLFGLRVPLQASTADHYYDHIAECLQQDAYRPRELYERFNIEVLTTTEGPLDELHHHRALRDSDWSGRIITAYRPDDVTDPDTPGFIDNVRRFGDVTGIDTTHWQGYLDAHRNRRGFFASMGATSTDHGHPSANTEDLSLKEAQSLFATVMSGQSSPAERERFRGQMLTEMAAMSVDDGLVMQLHVGALRSHHADVLERFGVNMGFDIPTPTNYVNALRPLLNRFGMNADLTIILFTLDETTWGRELAPLAGAYPCLKLGPAWWFFDSPAAMLRYREVMTETAGYYNTAGFNDDTRAFPSIPARHDVARRVDCRFLAEQVATHVLNEDEALEVAVDLSQGLARRAYRL